MAPKLAEQNRPRGDQPVSESQAGAAKANTFKRITMTFDQWARATQVWTLVFEAEEKTLAAAAT